MSRKFLEEAQADLQSQMDKEGKRPPKLFKKACAVWDAKHDMRESLLKAIGQILDSDGDDQFSRRLKRLTLFLHNSQKDKDNWGNARSGDFSHKLRDTLDKLLLQVGIKARIAAPASPE